MMTFKNYLAEATLSRWSADKTDLKGAIDFLNAHCTDGIQAVANRGLLFRGDDFTAPYIIMDSSTGLRTSKDSNNSYQLLMDNSEALKGYPSRSKSFICTSYYHKAEEFGSVYVFIPVNGTKVAVCGSNDMFGTEMIGLTSGFNIENFSDAAGDFFALFDVKKLNHKYTDMGVINAKLAKVSPGHILVAAALSFEETDSLHPIDSKLSADDWRTTRALEDGPYKNELSKIGRLIDEGKVAIDSSNMKRLYKIIKGAPENSRGTAIATALMTPQSLGLSIIQFGNSLEYDREVWFSGKCIAIRADKFANILQEFGKNKIKVNRDYFNFILDYTQ